MNPEHCPLVYEKHIVTKNGRLQFKGFVREFKGVRVSRPLGITYVLYGPEEHIIVTIIII